LRDRLVEVLGFESYEVLEEVKGSVFEGSVCGHPLRGRGYDRRIRLLPGDFVTGDQGTGFVHMSLDHGMDDFVLGKAYDLEPLELVGLDGKFKEWVPLFGGCAVWTREGKEGDANKRVMEILEEEGVLYGRGKLRHQYPHSWRSKAPLMTLVTPQWFVSMDRDGLRSRALEALESTNFYPKEGRRRLSLMIEERPDWCLSRQRSWGVPLPLFVHKKTGEVLRDEDVMDRVVSLFMREGADAWFSHDKGDFLGDGYDSGDYEQVMDVVDVWFDSGTTHRFVLDSRDDLSFPADMYLEGTDQHRGWFHSSLLVSCATRGVAPYKSILTHGFVVDGKGRKMSKSEGNTLDPLDVVKKLGAEILRLWVVECRYYHDTKADMELMKRTVDVYRRFRNTLRWMLGNLAHEEEGVEVESGDMSSLDRYMLHRVAVVGEEVRRSCEAHEYQRLYRLLHTFCALDLSALYFDVSKDTLYCDAVDAKRRRASMKVLRIIFDYLVRWLAPVLSFTAEEAYLCDKGLDAECLEGESVHMEDFLEVSEAWKDESLEARMCQVLRIRQVVLGALEVARVEGLIGSSLEAHAMVYVDEGVNESDLVEDMERICLTSGLSFFALKEAPEDSFFLGEEKGVRVSIVLAEGKKCERCWMVLPEVGSFTRSDVCGRCDGVLEGLGWSCEEEGE
jgi:isoleucyl-tRNA synthetase